MARNVVRILWLFVLCASFGLPSHGLDPEQGILQYNCRTWTRDSGLPTDGVRDITLSKEGYLWLGTSRGIAYFDGISFHIVEPPVDSPIAGKVITSLAPRKDGGIWFGTEGAGLGFYDNVRYERYDIESSALNSATVSKVLVTRKGELALGTMANVYSLNVETRLAREFPVGGAVDVMSLYENGDRRLWIGTAAHGVFSWSDGVLRELPDRMNPGEVVETIVEDHEGRLWVGTSVGLRIYSADLQPLDLGLVSFPEVKSLLADRDGAVWIGTSGEGLYRYFNGELSSLKEVDGLASDYIYALEESSEGSIWIGSSKGLSQLSAYKFPTYSDSEGLPHVGALSVAADPGGGVWVGTPNGASLFDSGSFASYGGQGRDGFTSTWIKYVYAARSGDVFFIGAAKNVDLLRGGKVVKSWVFDAWPRRMAEDGQGIVLAVADTLLRFENDEFAPYTLKDGSTYGFQWISDLGYDARGSLWVATGVGLYEVRDGAVIDHMARNKLPPTRCSEMAFDAEGGVWIAGRDGIGRCKDGVIRMMDTNYRLPQFFINTIVADGLGSFWLDTNHGIVKAREADLIAAVNKTAPSLPFELFEGQDAVRTTEKIAYEHSGCRTLDGRVWFPSSEGLVMIDPENLPPPRPSPPVLITEAWVDGQPYDLRSRPELAPGSRNLQIDYVALDYVAPRLIQYRYRLDGVDEDWVVAGTRRSAFYTNLAPGDYRFEVEAGNSDGVWNEVGASLDITFPPRFYEQTGFRLLVSLALCALIGYIVWAYNMRRERTHLRRAHDLLEERVIERTAELASANADLRLEVEERKRAQDKAEKLQEEMAEAAKRAQLAAEAKSQFLANMSHEIRTPMNAIIGFNDLLLNTKLDEEQKEFAEIIRNGSESLMSILNDILDFSKIEAGKLQMEDVEFDLNETLEETTSLVAIRAVEKKLELALFIEPDLPRYWHGDPMRLRQVLMNLIGNGVKFTSEGSVQVNVSCDRSGGEREMVMFEIVDTGVGVAPEVKGQLFDPFFQGDNSNTRKYGGTGLGLAISQQIVRTMGGTIGFHSEAGIGSTFYFSVPLRPSLRANSDHSHSELRGVRAVAALAGTLTRRVIDHYATAAGMEIRLVENVAQMAHSLRERLDGPFALGIVEADAQNGCNGELTRQLSEAAGVSSFPLLIVGEPKRGGGFDRSRAPAGVVVVRKPVFETSFSQACLRALRSAPREQANSDESPGNAAAALADKRLAGLEALIVEDNEYNQKLAQITLQKFGCRFTLVRNGREALEMLANRTFDIVLMDCHMPVMDGYEATRNLRGIAGCRDTFVVAMTANAMVGDREKCLEAGMDDYLSKPIDPDRLKAFLLEARRRKSR